MYCGNCGKEVEENSRFCSNCGSIIGQTNNSQEQALVQEVNQPDMGKPEEAPKLQAGNNEAVTQVLNISAGNNESMNQGPINTDGHNKAVNQVLYNSTDNSDSLEQIMGEQLSTHKKKRRIIIPMIIAILLLFGAVTATVFVTSSDGFKLKRQLSLGEKYLSDMEYEKAVAAFTKAINIEPNCVEAYVGLSDAYMGLGDVKEAEDTLLKGIDRVEKNFKDNKELIKGWKDLYIKLADIYIKAEKYKAARDILTRALQMEDNSDIRYKLREIEQNISEMLKKYQKLYDDFQKHFTEYIMTAEEATQYNGEIELLSAGIDNIDIDMCKDSVEGLQKLETLLVQSNLQLVTDKKDNLNLADTSGALDAERAMIEDYSAQAEDLIAKQFFVSAKAILDAWEKLLSAITKAGTGDYSMEVTQVDVSEYPIVKLYIRVADSDTGDTVDTLEYEYFTLKEKNAVTGEYADIVIDKAVQLDEQENTNISLVADVSSSMEGDPVITAKEIMKEFIGTIQFDIGDQAELITFASEVTTDVSFTSDENVLRQAADNIYTRDFTALYDALYSALNSTASQSGAKCIIAFTDGMDNESYTSYQQVVDLAQQYRIPIFIIGVGFDIDEYTLTYIAESSGGFYRNVNDISSMEEIYNNIYRQQKQLYLIQYRTQNPIDAVASQDVYINYDGSDITTRSEYEYTPSELMDTVPSDTSSPDTTSPDTASSSQDYIIYDSDSRYITASDLDWLSADEVRLARNEIYARRGRRFKDAALQLYFDSKPWYNGTIEPQNFSESVLNEYEKANISFIKQYEISKGYSTEGQD